MAEMSIDGGPIHELLFQNPVFEEGLNVTCRHGDKWFRRINGEGVRHVLVKETDGDSVGRGLILGCEQVDWSNQDDITKLIGWVHFEHDPSCVTVEGLRKEMQRVYGDGWDKVPMTVVFFTLY